MKLTYISFITIESWFVCVFQINQKAFIIINNYSLKVLQGHTNLHKEHLYLINFKCNI